MGRVRQGLALGLLLAIGHWGTGVAQKKFLEKVKKKTTTEKPRLLQTGDGEIWQPAYYGIEGPVDIFG